MSYIFDGAEERFLNEALPKLMKKKNKKGRIMITRSDIAEMRDTLEDMDMNNLDNLISINREEANTFSENLGKAMGALDNLDILLEDREF